MTLEQQKREDLMATINKYTEILKVRGFLTDEERAVVRECFFELFMMDTGQNPHQQV